MAPRGQTSNYVVYYAILLWVKSGVRVALLITNFKWRCIPHRSCCIVVWHFWYSNWLCMWSVSSVQKRTADSGGIYWTQTTMWSCETISNISGLSYTILQYSSICVSIQLMSTKKIIHCSYRIEPQNIFTNYEETFKKTKLCLNVTANTWDLKALYASDWSSCLVYTQWIHIVDL